MRVADEDAEGLDEERELVLRAKQGDGAAMRAIYETHAPRLYRRILLPRLGDVQAAEDALAETFRAAIEHLDRYEPREVSISHWLSRIAHNKAMDMHRARAVSGRRLADLRMLLEPLSGPEETADRLLELSADASEVRGRVRGVLDRLNPRYRRAIELRFLEERSREDCAGVLEVKLGTFDVLLLRALRAFRAGWEAAFAPREEGCDVGTHQHAACAAP